MARRGPAYPITDEWKSSVRLRLKEISMTEKQLASRIGCAQSTISETLSPASMQSSLVPDIHKVLGWPEPGVPVPSGEYSEVFTAWSLLPDVMKQGMLDQVRGFLKRQNDDEN
jgi:hypothetical protein